MAEQRTDDLVVPADGLPRCGWAGPAEDYRTYHDTEWGRPVRGERALYERLTLEAFQSGLSWLTILRKRQAFRAAFEGFDPERVARYGDADRARLLADAGIVRNRAKVDAAVRNARAVLALRDAVDGGLDALVWSYADDVRQPPSRLVDVPARTAESTALAAELRRHGFVLVGPTTVYAAMQACGVVNDHLAGCAFR